METILRIKVDEAVLDGAESYAQKMNITISDLISDYLLHISKSSINGSKINEVNSYQELVDALDAGMNDINNGRTYSHEVIKDYWAKKVGKKVNV